MVRTRRPIRRLAGYVLALILDAAVKHQAGSPHPDPIHLTAHFMRSAVVGPFEVHIKVLKVGKGYKNMSVNFVQNVRPANLYPE